MNFKSKLEAMSYAILTLSEMKNTETISTAIENIKISFENHEQNMEKICQYLEDLLPGVSDTNKKNIKQTIHYIKSSDYIQTLQEKFDNPLGRRAESELFTDLLLHPSDDMMKAVKEVSIRILQLVDQLLEEKTTALTFNSFLFLLTEDKTSLSCGRFKSALTSEIFRSILLENKSDTLPQILFIHFYFSLLVLRKIPIKNISINPPVGKLAHILDKIPRIKNHESFFKEIGKNTLYGEACRSYISDIWMCASELYTFSPGKGRIEIENIFSLNAETNQLGLMRKYQKNYADELPLCDSTSWIPDCRAQDPDFKSPHVLDLINYDAVYVSGPSGMTAVLLGQMEMLVNFDSVIKKQYYLSAVAAYIVGAGFHSLHEVIGPAQYCLGLVPDYPVPVPGKPKTDEEQKIPCAPQYHTYFKQQMDIDEAFSAKREAAWVRYLAFYKKYFLDRNYLQSAENELRSIKQSLDKVKNKEVILLIDSAFNKISHYIFNTPMENKLISIIENFIKIENYLIYPSLINIKINLLKHLAHDAQLKLNDYEKLNTLLNIMPLLNDLEDTFNQIKNRLELSIRDTKSIEELKKKSKDVILASSILRKINRFTNQIDEHYHLSDFVKEIEELWNTMLFEYDVIDTSLNYLKRKIQVIPSTIPDETKKIPSHVTNPLLLFSSPINKFKITYNGYNELTKAAVLNDLKFIEKSVSKDSKLINKYDQNKNTPLLCAVIYGHYQLVKYLLTKPLEVNIEQPDQHGNTPLMLAAENGHIDIFKLLISCDANIHAKNRYGKTAHLLAKRHSNGEIVNLIQKPNHLRI